MSQNEDNTIAEVTNCPPIAPYPPGVMVKISKTTNIQGDVQIKVGYPIFGSYKQCTEHS